MKKNTHPELHTIVATCTCGNTFELESTISENPHLDTCSKCHPFYTGQQKVVTSGRIDKYRKRFGSISLAK